MGVLQVWRENPEIQYNDLLGYAKGFRSVDVNNEGDEERMCQIRHLYRISGDNLFRKSIIKATYFSGALQVQDRLSHQTLSGTWLY